MTLFGAARTDIISQDIERCQMKPPRRTTDFSRMMRPMPVFALLYAVWKMSSCQFLLFTSQIAAYLPLSAPRYPPLFSADSKSKISSLHPLRTMQSSRLFQKAKNISINTACSISGESTLQTFFYICWLF